MNTKNITQTVSFDASPREIYEMLMDSKKHSEFTGAKAEIDNQVGGDFSVYDGSITGKNIELISGEKIVQSWRSDSTNWPEDYFSTVTFTLSEEDGKTLLTLEHNGIPEAEVDDINDGWREYYWEPMQKMLKK